MSDIRTVKLTLEKHRGLPNMKPGEYIEITENDKKTRFVISLLSEKDGHTIEIIINSLL